MLIKIFLSLCELVINAILVIFEVLPDFPEEARLAIDGFFDLIFSNCSLISFFIPVDYCLALLGVAVAIESFNGIYKVLMWALKKIPMLGIE